MRFLLVLVAILIDSKVFAQSRSGHICYFSMNNLKEQKYMANLADTLNKKTGSSIKVTEYMNTRKGDPHEEFRRMVEKGEKCDALVISGHHYGEWDGEQTDGSLQIGFIEKMACDPKYEQWFKQINALYLQGCRTVGAEDIRSNNPNSHSVRVYGAGNHTPRTSLMRGLNYGFSNLLSKSNVLSARYLKAFPRATTFGWVDSAPSFEAKSEMSLLYHISRMAQTNKPYLKANENVVEVSNADAAKLATAVLDIIQKPDSGSLDCENTAITAWNAHLSGAKAINSHTYEVNRPSKPKEPKDRGKALEDARKLGCELKNAKTPEAREAALNKILQSEASIGQNFNFMMELMQGEHSAEVGKILKGSTLLSQFIGDAINASNVGTLVKIDYYMFYKKVYGERRDSMENIVNGETIGYLKEPDLPESSPAYEDAYAFKRAIMQSVITQNHVDEKYMMELFNIGTPAAKQAFKSMWWIMLAEGKIQNNYLKDLAAKLKPLADPIP